MNMKKDIKIECKCGNSFIWTVRGQEFFEKQGYNPPKKCWDCKIKDRA
jgi:hypothetical protein